MNDELLKELINEIKVHNKLMALDMAQYYYSDLLPSQSDKRIKVLLPIANNIIESLRESLG